MGMELRCEVFISLLIIPFFDSYSLGMINRSGSFDQILPPLGSRYDEITCGWLGFGATMAMIVGGIITGIVIDTPPWNRRFAVLLRLGALATLAVMALFTIAMPT